VPGPDRAQASVKRPKKDRFVCTVDKEIDLREHTKLEKAINEPKLEEEFMNIAKQRIGTGRKEGLHSLVSPCAYAYDALGRKYMTHTYDTTATVVVIAAARPRPTTPTTTTARPATWDINAQTHRNMPRILQRQHTL
jgi:hypothetical protein